MNVRFGTAGYAYSEWVGGFYPRGTAQHTMLPFYATQFPAVEINSSFYRPPTPEQTDKMARRTPPGFGFTFKVPKSVSHERSADDLPPFKRAVDRMAGAGKLLGLVFQVPESFHNTADNRAWLTRVGGALEPHRVAVEFRHRSWAAPNLHEWMEHVGMDVVSVGVPELPTLFPRGLRICRRHIYARLHSENPDTWYESGKRRYKFDYPDATLTKLADGLKRAAEGDRADEALIFFNNCVGTQPVHSGSDGAVRFIPDAVANAHRLAALLRASAPAVRIIEPARPRQASLFGDDGSA
jgi:uncharacterized protein YecE (DUF72 family)